MTKNSDQMTLHCPLPYKTYISHTYLYFWSSICARKASLAAATLVFLASRPILAAYLFLVTFFSVLALGDGSEQMAASANLDVGSYIRGSSQKYDFIKIMSYEENMTHGLVFVFYQAAAFYFL